MQKFDFDFPLNDGATPKGCLRVTGQLERTTDHFGDAVFQVEFEKIIHTDPKGRKSDITFVVEQHSSDLYNTLEYAAENFCRPTEDADYTLMMQDHE